MPREKAAIIAKMSFLLPVLASIELARKANMARRQGLKPTKRPAAKTVATDDKVRSSRALSVALLAHVGEIIVVFEELSLAEANDKIVTSITVGKIALMQNRNAFWYSWIDISQQH